MGIPSPLDPGYLADRSAPSPANSAADRSCTSSSGIVENRGKSTECLVHHLLLKTWSLLDLAGSSDDFRLCCAIVYQI